MGNSSAKPGWIVKSVDHLTILAEDAEAVFAFLSETLQLPVVWPVRKFGGILSGGVFAGNVNIEIMQPERGHVDLRAKAASSKFYAISFEPVSLPESLQELNARQIPHSPPIPFWGERHSGTTEMLWKNILVGGLFDEGASTLTGLKILRSSPWLQTLVGYVFGKATSISFFKRFYLRRLSKNAILITQYTHDVNEERQRMREMLHRNSGGKLGIEALCEITVCIANYEEKLVRWQKLFAPNSSLAPGNWVFPEGPAIRFVPGSKDGIQSVMLKTALNMSQTDLENYGLSGEVIGETLSIRSPILEGLDFRLTH